MELSRRSFIEGSAALTGAAAIASLAPAAMADEVEYDRPWEHAPEPITDAVDGGTYDILVIGAGIGGVAAAEAASTRGASVLVVEQSEGITFHGVDLGHVGSKWQKENGYDIDPADAAMLVYRWSQQTANYNLIRTWAERSGKVFDYLQELAAKDGIQMVKALSPTSKWGWDQLDDYWRLLPSAVSFVKEGDGMITTDGKMVTSRIILCLADNAMANGAEFIFNNKAEQLVKDEAGKVCGVIATAADGSHVQYNATKGVILATGDISGNKAMLKDWAPITLRADVCGYYPAGGNMGDGITMGIWAGAALSKSPAAPMVHLSNQQSVLSARLMCWLAVNREGLRYGAEMPVEPLITNARMNQPGNVAWSIYDGNFAQFVQQQNPESYQSMLYSKDRATGEDVYIQTKIDNAVASGLITTADTLEELAEECGFPVETFLATVERYNHWCDTGVDEDFGVPANWLSRIGVPPFYAEPVPTNMLVCIQGLHVNNDSQVCTAEDEPIPGLFAVGNVQGDFFGNSYTVHCPGISHGRAITFGNLVGAALAQDTVISKTA